MNEATNALEDTNETYQGLWYACDEAVERVKELGVLDGITELETAKILIIGSFLTIIAKSILLLVSVVARVNKDVLRGQEVKPWKSLGR